MKEYISRNDVKIGAIFKGLVSGTFIEIRDVYRDEINNDELYVRYKDLETGKQYQMNISAFCFLMLELEYAGGKALSFRKFRTIVKSMVGKFDEHKLVFTESSHLYKAEFLPKFPKRSSQDKTITCECVTGQWSESCESGKWNNNSQYKFR